MEYSYLHKYMLINPLSGSYKLGVVILKPGYKKEYVISLKEFCIAQELTILEELPEMKLAKEFVIALYPEVFGFSEKDLQFGVDWKQLVIDYFTSGPVKIFIISGNDSTKKLHQFKHQIREENNKITDPAQVIIGQDFEEKVVKNLIHVIDKKEIPNFLWLIK